MATRSGTKTVHAHGCPTCRSRYEDNCEDRTTDEQCSWCRAGRSMEERGIHYHNRQPKDCCRQDSRIATKEEIKSYTLAGASTWYICKTCARTHPTKPRNN